MHMEDWEEKLHKFLQFNGREVLQNFGKVRREVAEALAYEPHEIYDANLRMIEAADIDTLTDGVKKVKQ